MPKIEDAPKGTSKPSTVADAKRAKAERAAAKGKANGQPSAVPPVASQPVRPVIYPFLAVNGIPIPWASTVITEEVMRDILWWETEEEYVARRKAEDPTLEARLKAEGKELSYGEDYLLKDGHKRKVRCHNNDNNRPFDEAHARKLAQDILNREWAGRVTFGDLQEFPLGGEDPWTDEEGVTHQPGDTIRLPEGTCNGEAIIIGRTGQCESVQHRGAGFMLACEMWEMDEPGGYWRTKWPEKPVIESIIITGVSESPRVIKTIDNVKPRTLSDVFYTSPLFQAMDRGQRKECARMLAKATELLMTRTGELTNAASHAWAATHSESLGFVDRHKRLLECLAHLFACNQDRVISGMNLSAGQMAAVMYLMGSSASKMDDYRACSPPCEETLKWTRWKRACDFWTAVGKNAESVAAVKGCLTGLEDPDGGNTGKLREKLVILSRAWTCWVKDEPITEEAIDLKGRSNGTGDWANDRDGKPQLIAHSCFGGCDLGDKSEPKTGKTKEDQAKTEEEAKRIIREQRAEKAAQLIMAVKGGAGLQGKKDAPAVPLAEEAAAILAKREQAKQANVGQMEAGYRGAPGEVKVEPQQFDKAGKPVGRIVLKGKGEPKK